MDLIVSGEEGAWQVKLGSQVYRCAVGRGGIRRDKQEGDGATPLGCWRFRRLLYRPDRAAPPETALPAEALAPDDGWSDDPADPAYNRLVKLPHGPSHERLWREDEIYDLIVVLGHNDDPPRPGAGSAIFLHVARPDYTPTEGCIALAREDLVAVLAEIGPADRLCVEPER